MRLIKTVTLKDGQALHFSVLEFQGKPYFDVRIFFLKEGKWLATKRGMRLRADLLDSFISGLLAIKGSAEGEFGSKNSETGNNKSDEEGWPHG